MNKHIINSLWLIADKFFVLFGSLVVYVLISRHLGPEEFGKMSLGVAVASLAVSISHWGANHTIFNIAIVSSKRALRLINATEIIRFAIYIFIWLIATVFFYLNDKYSQDVWLLSIIVLFHIFLGLDIYQFYYNATLKSKINATSNIIARFSSMFIRLLFVFLSLKAIWFTLGYLINNYILYYLRKRAASAPIIKQKGRYIKFFIDSGKYFTLSAVFAFIYTKVNELMLIGLSDYNELGIFNVAITVGYCLTFIPQALGISYITKAFSAIGHSNKIQGFAIVNAIMVIVYLPMVLLFHFFSEELIFYTFGEAYANASKLLWITAVAGLLSSLNIINNRIVGNISKGSKYLFKKVIFCSIISVPLSYFLISHYGTIGAAISLVLIELINLTLANYFIEKGLIFKVHKSILKVTPMIIYKYIKA